MAYSVDKQIQSRRHYANKKNGTARRYKQGLSLFSLLNSSIEHNGPARLSKRERQQLFLECFFEAYNENQINEYLKNKPAIEQNKSLKLKQYSFDILLILSFTLFPYIIGSITDSFITGLASAISLPFIILIISSFWDES